MSTELKTAVDSETEDSAHIEKHANNASRFTQRLDHMVPDPRMSVASRDDVKLRAERLTQRLDHMVPDPRMS